MMKTFFGSVKSPSSSSAYSRSIVLVAVLEQEVELAEDLGEVAAVDLVDDQDVRRPGSRGLVDDAPHRAGSARTRLDGVGR